jgi:hypothetical protein
MNPKSLGWERCSRRKRKNCLSLESVIKNTSTAIRVHGPPQTATHTMLWVPAVPWQVPHRRAIDVLPLCSHSYATLVVELGYADHSRCADSPS